MVRYVIPGVVWVVKILEGWTYRLNKHGLIYAGLTWTGESFSVSAVKSDGSINNKGRERLLVRDRKGRVLKRRISELISSRYEILTVLILCSSFNYCFVIGTLAAQYGIHALQPLWVIQTAYPTG